MYLTLKTRNYEKDPVNTSISNIFNDSSNPGLRFAVDGAELKKQELLRRKIKKLNCKKKNFNLIINI